MSFLYSPVFIATAYAGEEAVKRSKGMPLHIIIPFTIAMIPVFFALLLWLTPKVEKKFGSKQAEEQE